MSLNEIYSGAGPEEEIDNKELGEYNAFQQWVGFIMARNERIDDSESEPAKEVGLA